MYFELQLNGEMLFIYDTQFILRCVCVHICLRVAVDRNFRAIDWPTAAVNYLVDLLDSLSHPF